MSDANAQAEKPTESHFDLVEQTAADQALANQRAEERRLAAIEVVNALFRLVKVLRIHTESNQATLALIESMAKAVADYCSAMQVQSVSMLFADDTVFVNGQMLRASRETYASALELGAFLAKLGAAEITFDRMVSGSEVTAFARAMTAVMRKAAPADSLLAGDLPCIHLRSLRGGQGSGAESVDDESSSRRILRTYSTGVVVLRGFHAQLARGEFVLPNRIRRIAQKLVVHADEDAVLLARLAASRIDEPDDALASVHAAILAVLMARKLTDDRAVLAALATAALLHDAARYRLIARAPAGAKLTEADRDRLPASSVVALTSLGRIQSSAIVRTVLAFEAAWSDRAARRGPVYRGRRPPTVFAGILAVARTFQERMIAGRATRTKVDDVIQAMVHQAADDSQRTVLRLLLAVLGIAPGGTPVELNTGENAQIVGSPVLPIDALQPQVRLAGAAGAPRVIDLAAMPARGEPVRWIRRMG